MATFFNQANLSYNGGNTNSNIVSGELVEVLSVTKTAVGDEYSAGDTLTYAVNIINTGTTPFTGLTLSDNLGQYEFEGLTLYPLSYEEGTVRYFQNGVLQAEPTVTAGPPLVISGISVPAGGNTTVLYSVNTTASAPLAQGSTITNTVNVTGGGLLTPLTASETVNVSDAPVLTISKGLNPTTVTENSELTYTFTIRNVGNTDAVATDNLVVTDNFDPILRNITVTLNGVTLTEGTDYSYNEATGEFVTVAGVITVPAASYTQDTTTGEYTVVPGVSTLVVVGTV